MPINSAAWIGSKKASLVVGPAPYTRPLAHQVVVKNAAVAINPVDWMKQLTGDIIYGWVKYPFVLGTDVAGEVVEVGDSVTRFAAGDRVVGLAIGAEKSRNTAAEGAFQLYTVLSDHMTSAIPDDVSFEAAVVVPLGISTAASGLFQTNYLGLRHPSVSLEPTGETVLVWGGATSVGANAIQLAVAAGYDVLATASPRNAPYVESLGARQVFDYRSPTVVADLIAALRGATLAGALAVGTGSAEPCVEIVGASTGRRFVALTSPSVAMEKAMTPALAMRFLASNVALQLKARRARVRVKYVWGADLKDNEVGPAIFENFLPGALAGGSFIPSPPPVVVGHGLESIQLAFEAHRRGVSAAKVVVTL